MTLALERLVDALDVPVDPEVTIPVPRSPIEEQGATVPEVDMALESLRAYYGADVNGYDAVLRKIYRGPASDKRQVGGAMHVYSDIMTAEGVERRELVVDDENRPLPEAALAALGTLANANWNDPKKRWIDDICD